MNRFKPSQQMLGASLFALGLIAQPLVVGPASAQQQKPNILFILADNTGYGDLGVYGGGELRGAPTPRIDQFAAEGLRLTQFLVEPACTPSRAALMTARYSIRSGLSLVAVEGSTFSLPAKEITMAEMLRDAGYATAIFGKWHLGAQSYSQPQNKGFDEFYGIPPADTWDAFGMIRQATRPSPSTFRWIRGRRSSRPNVANL
jgi:arylsulfatase A-like enzyme